MLFILLTYAILSRPFIFGHFFSFLHLLNNQLVAILSLREWLKELMDTISDYEKLENPSDFPLYQVLFAYYDLREKERWAWHSGARSKAGLNDLTCAVKQLKGCALQQDAIG